MAKVINNSGNQFRPFERFGGLRFGTSVEVYHSNFRLNDAQKNSDIQSYRGHTPAESKLVENHLYEVGIQQSVIRARQELTKVWDEVPSGAVAFEPTTFIYTE